VADPLDAVIEALTQTQWAAMVLDADDRLRWVSDEFKYFMRETDDAKLGIGTHFVSAMVTPAWMATMTDQGRLNVLDDVVPFVIDSFRVSDEAALMPEPFDAVLGLVQPRERPEVWTGVFEYLREDLPPYDARYLSLGIRDADGARCGTLVITFMGMPARLLAQLVGGDFPMQARMAELADPGRHAAAIVFVDLQGSAALSRRLPTAAFFNVIRRVTCEFDRVTAAGRGLVGKHVGDGMTAFFLPEHCGSAAAAASAALGAVQEVQKAVIDIAAELDTGELRLNVGLHWGPGLYLGQLVPGGRLEITALGDEVNQAARIQECARDGRVLASKAFVEQLDQTSLDVRPRYEQLQDLPGATAKAIADAGQIAVTTL
jgi:class 3 adenylate cyclase